MRTQQVAWLVTASLLVSPSAAMSVQLNATVSPTVETAEKGKTFQINVTLEAEDPLDSLEIVVLPPENFCARAVDMLPSAGFSAENGAARLRSLTRGSRTTIQFLISTPTENRFTRSGCDPSETHDSTRL